MEERSFTQSCSSSRKMHKENQQLRNTSSALNVAAVVFCWLYEPLLANKKPLGSQKAEPLETVSLTVSGMISLINVSYIDMFVHKE